MIFLSGCTHACVFCQNHDINLQWAGEDTTTRKLADAFLHAQSRGYNNLHWVTPTQQLPWLLEALQMAQGEGMTLPLVYNSGGYESADTLRLLDGVVDIYLPDFKFWSDKLAWRYVRVRDYAAHTREAILEMKRQVGDLQTRPDGIATNGLIVRHLVMPGCLDDSAEIFKWIASALGPETYVTLLPQYEPVYKAKRHPEINRRLYLEEWAAALDLARAAGLQRLYDHGPVDRLSCRLPRKTPPDDLDQRVRSPMMR